MTTAIIPAAGMASPPPGDVISYDGQAGRLFRLGFKVAALTLITLGIYRFWGKTEIRRYLWSRLRLAADRLEYTGTGKELFIGFLIVLAVLIPYGILSQTLVIFSVVWSPLAQGAVSVAQAVFILFLFGYAIYRARRYRLSRTLLRGIRFGQMGSAARYGMMFLGYILLTVVTLGIAKPVGDVALYRFQTRNSLFGDQPFDFEGRGREMMGRWIVCLILIPFTLGLSLLWYAAFKMRYFAGGTRFGDVTFALPVKLWDLIRVYFPYLLVMLLVFGIFTGVIFAPIFSAFYQAAAVGQAPPLIETTTNILIFAVFFVLFGILAPVFHLVLVTHRFLRLVVERLDISGAADFESIIQGAAQKAGVAEGLADAIDVGGGVEVGF